MSKFKKDNFIFNTFLNLTSRTYPYGLEDGLVADMKRRGIFPEDLQKDVHGNYYYQIGESRTIFASHLDTATKVSAKVNHVFDGDIIKTDGTTVLGADDKAGVTVMLWMMNHKVPGLYYFFIGEEVGCIGSGLAAKYGDFKGKYDRIISFDRKGTNSVITYQSSSRSCSDDFAKQLAKELNKSGLSYKLDDTGVYTDSAEFVDVIPECTNLSVGYYSEHTVRENQDIKHLTKLANACLLVDWENLVTKRDMSKMELKSMYTNSYSTYETSDWRSRDQDYGDYGYSSRSRKKRNRRSKNRNSYHDDWYDQSPTTYNNWTSFVPAGKSYYDGIDGLVEVKKPNEKDFSYYSYDWIMTKFTNKDLDYDTLMTIKEQYLDMSNSSDRDFYNYLLDVASEQSL